jgi:hypothetical protein
MMKYLLPLILVILVGTGGFCQNPGGAMEGKISYTTTQNVYVKFQSTDNLVTGDTLFTRQDANLVPAFIVREISSISCVCTPISSQNFSVGDVLLTRQKNISNDKAKEISPVTSVQASIPSQDTVIKKTGQPKKRTQIVSGNISVASYLNFSNETTATQRMKYTLALTIDNIGGSKLSAETYISFAHKLNDWSEVQSDVFNGLKIYSFALNYQINKNNTIWLGRKINPRISNAGAIDGLQYELHGRSFTVGIIAGTRPDYKNYSFNSNLLQFGGYLGHDLAGKNGSMQTTLAFIDQLNQGLTDRRFAYLQHTNSLIKNLYFFGSAEVDLYKKSMNKVDTVMSKDTTFKQDNSPTLSNLYLSLRYRPFRQLSVSFSYSARQNVIYYETYKSLVERMLQAATVNGYTLQVNYQPVKRLSIGANAGYRDSKTDPKATKNLYGYLTYSQIPGINVAATISATILETGYMSGKIYSAAFSRDIVAGRLSAELAYRFVNYKFYSNEVKLVQNIAELNFSWRILKKLSCGVYYEGTFDKTSIFNRVYANITQRF